MVWSTASQAPETWNGVKVSEVEAFGYMEELGDADLRGPIGVAKMRDKAVD